MNSQKQSNESEYDGEYDEKFILASPIPAECRKCRAKWIDEGKFKDAIRAPTLDGCRCFYCGGNLKPLDRTAYNLRLKELPKDRKAYQPDLFGGAAVILTE